MIERRTRSGGRLELHDHPTGACTTCQAGPEPGPNRDLTKPIGLTVVVGAGAADGAALETSICANCLAEAIAILWGRKHLEEGGAIGDLRIPAEPEPVERRQAADGHHHNWRSGVCTVPGCRVPPPPHG